MFDVDADRECTNNLAAETGYAELKAKLRDQMMRELKEQQDPRVLGRGHVFDEYLYSSPATRSFYERYMKGEKVRAGWVNASDFEKEPID